MENRLIDLHKIENKNKLIYIKMTFFDNKYFIY